MYKISITYCDVLIGTEITKDGQLLDWSRMNKEEQQDVLDIFGSSYEFFSRTLRNANTRLS